MQKFTGRKWTILGWVSTVVSGLFLLFDSVIHILRPPEVVQAFVQMGYNPAVALYVGLIELLFVVLYFIPRTSVFGAVLLTGYLGGAVDVNVRGGNPLWGFILFPVYTAIIMWGGLYLRSERLRGIIFKAL
jgi:hypothetical protein